MSIVKSKAHCESGCMKFTGGEIRHDKNCYFYPESLTHWNDQKREEITALRKECDDYRAALEGAMHTIFAINGSVDVSIKAILAKYKEKP